jgi:(3,5-dihydroxyphenyl)acetyl-CoA 1,2-dioxygenase
MQIVTDAAASWAATRPSIAGHFEQDAQAHSKFWRTGADMLAALPSKPARNPEQARTAETVLRVGRESREAFLKQHTDAIYSALTKNRTMFVRADDLAYEAAKLVPGLVPTREQVAAESPLMQRDKDGVEIDQGIFFSNILAHPVSGAHLCHTMLLPKPESVARLPELAAKGTIDLGTASVERRGKVSIVLLRNPRFLNAEDESTLNMVETAVDLALLDPQTEIAVLRGGTVDHPKHRGRHVFCTGINLTQLYRGKISYLWYVTREMGFVNKFFRGLARQDADPDEMRGGTQEKPWVAAVEAFAIGGGCQYLLTMDYVVAASDAYMTLPARKEGIIPGAANMRLPRFTGDRIARQAIMYDRRLDCDTPEGRLICDEIVPRDGMDEALDRITTSLTDSGVVSAASNRRAFRVAEEPLDMFRRYMAVYAREQAYCHFSPALIANLERYWNAQSRNV